MVWRHRSEILHALAVRSSYCPIAIAKITIMIAIIFILIYIYIYRHRGIWVSGVLNELHSPRFFRMRPGRDGVDSFAQGPAASQLEDGPEDDGFFKYGPLRIRRW